MHIGGIWLFQLTPLANLTVTLRFEPQGVLVPKLKSRGNKGKSVKPQGVQVYINLFIFLKLSAYSAR